MALEARGALEDAMLMTGCLTMTQHNSIICFPKKKQGIVIYFIKIKHEDGACFAIG